MRIVAAVILASACTPIEGPRLSVDTGATTVYVTVDGRSSNVVTFEVLP